MKVYVSKLLQLRKKYILLKCARQSLLMKNYFEIVSILIFQIKYLLFELRVFRESVWMVRVFRESVWMVRVL